MNPTACQALMNPATYSNGTGQVSSTTTGTNWFDMSAWTKMMQPAPQANPEKEES